MSSDHQTAAIGTFTVLFALGQTLGPLAIGMITDRTGSVRAGLFIGATLIMVGAALSLLQRDVKN